MASVRELIHARAAFTDPVAPNGAGVVAQMPIVVPVAWKASVNVERLSTALPHRELQLLQVRSSASEFKRKAFWEDIGKDQDCHNF